MEDLLGSLLLTTVIPIRIGGKTAWEAVRNDFIENKEKIASKDYELHGRCAVLFCKPLFNK